MIRKYSLYVLLAIIFSQLNIVNAASDGDTHLQLTLEDAQARVISHHANTQHVSLRITYLGQQLNDLKQQKERLDHDTSSFAGGQLPVNPEYFLQYFPDYDQLTEAEQLEIDQYIATQVMINHSLNQLLDAQAEQQQLNWKQELSRQRKILNDAIQTTDIEYQKAQMELKKIRKILKFEVLQKYNSLLIQLDRIDALNIEIGHLNQYVQDTKTLYEFGRATTREISEAEDLLLIYGQQLDALEREYVFNFNEFKILLGIPLTTDVTLQFQKLKTVKDKLINIEWPELSKVLKENYDMLMMKEDIGRSIDLYHGALEQHEETELLFAWIMKVDERERLEQHIEYVLREYRLEYDHYMSELNRIEREHDLVKQQQDDLSVQYTYGLITIRELEANQVELEKSEVALQKLNWEVAIFIEKVRLATEGVMP